MTRSSKREVRDLKSKIVQSRVLFLYIALFLSLFSFVFRFLHHEFAHINASREMREQAHDEDKPIDRQRDGDLFNCLALLSVERLFLPLPLPFSLCRFLSSFFFFFSAAWRRESFQKIGVLFIYRIDTYLVLLRLPLLFFLPPFLPIHLFIYFFLTCPL